MLEREFGFKVCASILIPFRKFARSLGSCFPSAWYLCTVSPTLTLAISTYLFSLLTFCSLCLTMSPSSAAIANLQLIHFQRPRNNCTLCTIIVWIVIGENCNFFW